MNITFSLEDKLVKEVRKIAVERDTTLTGLVREYLGEAGGRACTLDGEGEKGTPWNVLLSSSGSKWGNEPGDVKTYMPVPDFLDSNVLVYAYDASAALKQQVAQDLLRKAIGAN